MSILSSKFIALSSISESSTHLKSWHTCNLGGRGGKRIPGVHWPSILAKKASSCFNKGHCLKKRNEAESSKDKQGRPGLWCHMHVHRWTHLHTEVNTHIHTQSVLLDPPSAPVSVSSCHSSWALWLFISKLGWLLETKNICALLLWHLTIFCN